MSEAPKHGIIAWIDLTIPDADKTRDFYSRVVGWNATDVEMGGYNDYCMNHPVTGDTVAGICHAKGQNQGLPSQWMLYITVPDLDRAMSAVKENGGRILREPTSSGAMGRFCVFSDPAGAVAALFQPA